MIDGDNDEKSCIEAINMIMMITIMVHNMNEKIMMITMMVYNMELVMVIIGGVDEFSSDYLYGIHQII